jgi:hypothetical protein
MGELQERLRALGCLASYDPISPDTGVHATLHEAADELDRLTAEVKELRAQKWQVRHTSTAETMVQQGMEIDRLTAENARLRAKLELTPENVERVKVDIRTYFASDMVASIVATAAIKALGDE